MSDRKESTESDITEFKFVKYFNYLTYVGGWPAKSENSFKTKLNVAHQIVCLFGFYSVIIFQFVDLWTVFGNLEKMTYNMSISMTVVMTAIKGVIFLLKSDSLKKLQRDLWLDYNKFNDEEDETFKNSTFDGLSFLANVFHVSSFILYSTCFIISLFSYKWGPRELPFPTFYPFSSENTTIYYTTFVVQFFIGLIPLGTAIETDLIILSFVNQIILQYKILHKDILKLEETYDWESINNGKREVNSLLRIENTKKHLEEIINRQITLNRYLNTFEFCFSAVFLVQIFGGGIILLMNGFQLISMTVTINFRLVYQVGYLAIIIIDIYCTCLYITILRNACKNIADAAFSIAWFKMDSNLQKFILMIVLKAQRPPKITAGKLITIDVNTFLTLLQSAFSWLILFRRLEMNSDEKSL